MKNKNGQHKYKKLDYKGESINIDYEIANLISLLWKLGVNTTSCCQEHCAFRCKHIWKENKLKDGTTLMTHSITKDCYNSIWIAFESSKDIELFYNHIGIWEKNFPDSYTWQVLSVMNNDGIVGSWKGKPISWYEDACGKNSFRLSPQLTFPRKDLNLVERLLSMSLEEEG